MALRFGTYNSKLIPKYSRIKFNSVYFRTLFIDTETTPNPHSMKFIPSVKEVLPEKNGTGMYFQKTELKEIAKSPLAKDLFTIEGIKGIFLGRSFITVTKLNDDFSWHQLKPAIFSKILDVFSSQNPIVYDHPIDAVSDTTILESDTEVIATIKELIETRVRPSVQDDGGDIFYEDFDIRTGIVKVRLAGSCVGCPSSSITLRNGVENMLMHYIPEVKGIEDVTVDSSNDNNTINKSSEVDLLDAEFDPNKYIKSGV
eukprot:gene13266-17772_t